MPENLIFKGEMRQVRKKYNSDERSWKGKGGKYIYHAIEGLIIIQVTYHSHCSLDHPQNLWLS